MPHISVVVPVYNGERTIEKTVRSILSQTFPDFELIVINDGSVDSTLDILTNIQDPRMKVFSYPNAGISASRNRGIEHACGMYISFMDADDLWTPEKLESQLNALQGNPDVAVTYSWTDFIDEGGNSLGYGIHRTVNGYVFQRLNGFDPLFGPFGPEDLDFSLRLQKAGYKAMYIPKAVGYHQVSHTFGEGYIEEYARHKSRH